MNYRKIYNQIINNGKIKSKLGYTEKHHIIPRSLGGDDSKENIVELTAREHFICHYLLAKMYPKESFEWYKMNHAFLMMKASSLSQGRYFNSRLYEYLKINFKSAMSESQQGNKNSQFGKIWIHNKELQKNKKWPKDKEIQTGWELGRVIKWNKPIIKISCKICGTLFTPIKREILCSEKCRVYNKAHQAKRADKLHQQNTRVMDGIKSRPVNSNQIRDNESFIVEAINKKMSIRSILRYLGFNDSGTNYNTIKKLMP